MKPWLVLTNNAPSPSTEPRGNRMRFVQVIQIASVHRTPMSTSPLIQQTHRLSRATCISCLACDIVALGHGYEVGGVVVARQDPERLRVVRCRGEPGERR